MIELKDVSKTYHTGVHALRNINLSIRDGEFCFIVGKSGSGKSTLVRLLTKELDADRGSIVVNDTDLQKLKRSQVPAYRRRLGVVFQDFRLLEDRTVYENIAFAQLIIGKPDDEIFENVTKILSLTGLSAKADSYPRQLSGGEQQRTAIARALVNRPEILIADEPTGNLDHENAEEIMKLLLRINSQGTTVIIITHDKAMVERMNKRTVSMSMGQIISDRISGPDTSKDTFETEEKTDWTDDWVEDWDEDRKDDQNEDQNEEDWLDDEFEDSPADEKIRIKSKEDINDSDILSKHDTVEISAEAVNTGAVSDANVYTGTSTETGDDTTSDTGKTSRGLKGAHRPHHKSGKEGTIR